MLSCGIYKIYNRITGRVYIGSSSRIEYRWSDHKRDLKNNVHTNNIMQNDYNNYGLESFEFEIVEECSKDMLLVREKYYAEDVFKSMYSSENQNTGYNLAPYVNDDYNMKLYVPHSKLSFEKVKIVKILLSIGMSGVAISDVMRIKYKTVTDIDKMLAYENVFSEYNEKLQNKDSFNLLLFCNRIDDFLLYLSKNGVDIHHKQFLKHFPYFISRKTGDCNYIRPLKNIKFNLSEVSIYKSDVDLLSTIKNKNELKIMLFMTLRSRYIVDKNRFITFASEAECITYANLKITHDEYVDAVNNLLSCGYMLVNKVYGYYELNRMTGIFWRNIKSDSNFELFYMYLANIAGISKIKISFCDKCNSPYISPITGKSKYCTNCRVNKKTSIICECICCGKLEYKEKQVNKYVCKKCKEVMKREKRRQKNQQIIHMTP